MAFNLTNADLQTLQNLQRTHQAQQLQQAQSNAARASEGRRRRRRQTTRDDATERLISEVGVLNRQNRHAFRAWYRRHRATTRAELARDCARVSADVARYGVSRPVWFVVASSRDQLRDLVQGLAGGQRLALFGLAVARQAEKGDITRDKVAVFNTVSGRPGDMPVGMA